MSEENCRTNLRSFDGSVENYDKWEIKRNFFAGVEERLL